MTVLEMHIALRQGVDRVNSLRNDQLRMEEVDLELNRAQLRFINQRYGRNNVHQRGFEENQKRIDDLRVLVKEFTGPAFFKEELSTGKIWVDSFEFPSDYLYLLNQRSTILKDRCHPIQFSLSPLPPVFYFAIPLTDLAVNNQFIDRIDLTNGINSATVWQSNPAFQYPQDTQAALQSLLNSPGNGFTAHWQHFGSINIPNNIIIVVDTDVHPWFNHDASIGTVTPLIPFDSQNQPLSGGVWGSAGMLNPLVQDMSMYSTRVPTGTFTREQALNRWSQLDDIHKLLDDPFNTTQETEPLTTIRGNFIDIHTNAIFLIEKVKITYLRKPLPISLPLAYDCELPEHAHEEIVSMAVSAILEGQTDPRYRTQMAEMLSRE